MSANKITLNAHLDITEAKTTHEQLSEAINAGDIISIDASRVERADTAGIQLLLAFKKLVEKQKKQIQWESPSRALSRSIKKLGLTDAIGI